MTTQQRGDHRRTYAEPGPHTDLRRHAEVVAMLPADPVELAGTLQALLVHEHLAPAYGIELSDAARDAVHLRTAAALVDRVLAADPAPLTEPRPVERRVAANCRHFSVLTVAVLRARGVPARARCGFGGYFAPGRFEDHWVCEHWDAERGRWVLLDAQVDDDQRELFAIELDTADVPRDRFVVAGDAWQQVRRGEADPLAFGLTITDEAGEWWVAGNLLRDAASLGKVELLPWDCWGAMPAPGRPVPDELATVFDELAARTLDVDADPGALARHLAGDERLRVPPLVHNEVRGRDEPL